ncbi:MAG: hypothetical protein BWY80_00317 [Firmicutes bacterium ADurb.Bin456]|nr:MAG: hypothetical protein BWY80_00317 [Firmicutes bacterium ADurb.Bin456]
MVASTDPAHNSTHVPLDKAIKVTFNVYVERGDTFNDISLMAGEDKVASLQSLNYSVITIYPSTALTSGTKYTVTIPRGAIKDVNCNPLKDPYTFSFTTVTLGDVNGDDLADIQDLLFIASKIGPVTNSESRKADVNKDNVVNILDILEIAPYINQ